MSGVDGYAVVDTETTGIRTGYRHRIAEIAVIHVDPDGTVADEWCTLVNPDRDLGPQAIHGIKAAEVRRAPRFGQIAGDVAERLAGRIVVAHNWPFDAMHLRAEFARLDVDTPLHARAGLCTMRAAAVANLGGRRSLIDCCAAAGIRPRSWHTARDDAMATAGLLGFFLDHHLDAVRLTAEQFAAAAWSWPAALRGGRVKPVHRKPVGHVEPHFLARLVERMPRDSEPEFDAYFAMLDDALLDRQICDTEADALLALAHDLGLHKSDVLNAHHTYLRELAKVAWEDAVLTDDERSDIIAVAILLGLDAGFADQVIEEERVDANRPTVKPNRQVSAGGLRLRPGDKVVVTGTMVRPRADIVEQATMLGLRITDSVSKQTCVVAAADPDSLSGKAKRARDIGVAVVDQHTFFRVLDQMADLPTRS